MLFDSFKRSWHTLITHQQFWLTWIRLIFAEGSRTTAKFFFCIRTCLTMDFFHDAARKSNLERVNKLLVEQGAGTRPVKAT